MSAIATGREARVPAPPSWLRTVGAVIGGTLLAWLSLFVVFLPFAELDLVPVGLLDAPGHGWPWRVDGLWSLAADLGPLLLLGAVFALGVEAYTSKWTGVRGWRLPVALSAATLGALPLNDPRPGLIPVGGLLAFVTVVWIARSSSIVERRRMRWTRGRVAAVSAGVLALACVSLSYGVVHPLSGSRTNAKPGAVVLLRNDGRLPVRLLGVSAPAHTIRRIETDGPTGTIPRGGSAYITLADGNCLLDHVGVRLHVAGRDVLQSVPLENQGAPPCV